MTAVDGRPSNAAPAAGPSVEANGACESSDSGKGFCGALAKCWHRVDARVDNLASFYVERPCVSFCSCVWLMLVLSVLSVASGCMKMHMDVGDPWTVMDSETAQNYIMISEAENGKDDAQDTALLTKPFSGASFIILYKSKAGSQVFSPEELQSMCRFERVIFQSGVYKDYCWRTAAGECTPQTVLQHFYTGGNISGYNWECELLDSNFVATQATAILSDATQNSGDSEYAFYLGKDAVSRGYSTVTRSQITLGYPSAKAQQKYVEERAKGRSVRDSNAEARDVYIDEVEDSVLELEKELFKVPDEEMKYAPGKLRKSAYMVDDDQFTSIGPIKVRFVLPLISDFIMIQSDFLFAFLSIIFVLTYMYIHLGSFFMACFGMLQIICSLPLAGLFYQGLFQVKFFQFLHVLTIFLVLGIGADDIFVFNDSWSATANLVKPQSADGQYTQEELKERMRMTYKRTASAIFNTSFTTAMAFLSCSVSKVMPMRTMGWYAALAVVLNYLLTVSMTPATTMIFHYRLKGKRCCCPGWMARTPLREPNTGPVVSAEPAPQRKALMERCLQNYYVPAMRYKYMGVRIVPLVVVVVLTAVGVQGVGFAFQLTPPVEEEAWFPDSHMQTSMTGYMRENYFGVSGDIQATMSLFWGIKGLDRSDFNAYDPWKNPGKPLYDENFDLGQPEAQQAILDTCRRIRQLPCNLEGCRAAANYGGTLALGTNHSVSCFLEDFGKWLEQKREAMGAPGGSTLPRGQQFFDELKIFRQTTAPTKLQREEGNADWISQIGFINGELKYVSVRFRSAMPAAEPVRTGKKVVDLLDDFTERERASAPVSAAGPRGASESFLWMSTSQELINGLFSGCALAGPVAFIVLIFATHNIIIALYAVLCVAAVVLCVLGFCQSAMGWALGVGESIAGVIMIGLAVDYIVHLAHMYVEADKFGHTTRDARATFAIENMGVTVFAGAITTVGAGLIMRLCFSTFFHKMAVLMSMTISYSFVFSLGLFMSLLYLAGPQGSTGDLLKCAYAIRGNKANEEPAPAKASEEELDVTM